MDFEIFLIILCAVIFLGYIIYLFIKEYFYDNPKEINRLKVQLSELEEQQNLKELQQQNGTLQKQNQYLSRQLSAKNDYIHNLYIEISELKEQNQNKQKKDSYISTLEEEHNLLKDENARLCKHIHDINEHFVSMKNKYNEKQGVLEQKLQLYESDSNLTAIPYMAQLIADFETYELEYIAKKLDWGSSQERLKKVKSLRELRTDAKAMVEKNKEAQYQLSYLLELFPELEDIIECEFKSLPHISINLVEDRDVARDYLSKEEYATLSTTERNQLALDRYLNSHNKSKWQIGRDYEQFVGYKYTLDGYTVDNFGTYKGLEDLGRDVIAKKENKTLIIQCKYWSSLKLIHEKHITQLYGTVMSYCIENNISDQYVSGVLVTNINLSDTAKEFAKRLHIEYIEGLEKENYPCIKCNIGATGEKIYHLPFDQQYDATKIEPRKGEFYALTVKEAEDAGFRRAHKWFS